MLRNHEGRDLRFVGRGPGDLSLMASAGLLDALPQAPADPGGAMGIAMRVPCGFIAADLSRVRRESTTPALTYA